LTCTGKYGTNFCRLAYKTGQNPETRAAALETPAEHRRSETNMSATILVTGPTGKVGRRLIPLLARRGVTARAASRSPVAARAGVEPVRFDWADESTYETARKGVDAMYLVAGSIPQPEHADYIRALLEGATGAGVERVVLLSSYGLDRRRRRTRCAASNWPSNRSACRTPSCGRSRSCRTSQRG
jgi:hypothetical protein